MQYLGRYDGGQVELQVPGSSHILDLRRRVMHRHQYTDGTEYRLQSNKHPPPPPPPPPQPGLTSTAPTPTKTPNNPSMPCSG